MRKTIFLFNQFLVAVLLAFLCVKVVSAAEQKNRRWVCLDADRSGGHVATLTSSKLGAKPLPGTATYIFVCIGSTCTTGDSQRDIVATGSDGLSILSGTYGYKFEGMNPSTNPLTSDSNGGIGSVTWQDSTKDSQTRIWMAMNFYTPSTTSAGAAGGEQQGTFSFDVASKKCVSIQWDPFGRVFDATTLEPVQGARVTLLFKKNGSFVPMTPSDVVGGGIVNPYTTTADGGFSFVVPDGEYKLVANPAALTDSKAVNAKYANAYYDIYPSLTGDDIVEQGGMQHRDVPIATLNTNTTATIMSSTITQGEGIIYVQGLVSHPLSKIITQVKRVYTNSSKVEIRDGDFVLADKLGKFAIEINQGEFANTAQYVDMIAGLRVEKVNLTTLAQKKDSSFFAWIGEQIRKVWEGSVVSAQFNSQLALEPIPSYIEGYAYDSAGKVLSGVTVGIYMKGGKNPLYTTQADMSGHFKVGSENIPPVDYDIRYTQATGVVTSVTKSTFLTQNHAYMAVNKVNAFEYRTTNQATGSSSITKTTSPSGSSGSDSSNSAGKKAGNSSTSGSGLGRTPTSAAEAANTNSAGAFAGMQGMVLVIVALVVLALIGVGAFIAMKSKRQETQTY